MSLKTEINNYREQLTDDGEYENLDRPILELVECSATLHDLLRFSDDPETIELAKLLKSVHEKLTSLKE